VEVVRAAQTTLKNQIVRAIGGSRALLPLGLARFKIIRKSQ